MKPQPREESYLGIHGKSGVSEIDNAANWFNASADEATLSGYIVCDLVTQKREANDSS